MKELFAILEESPDDWDTHRILADWMEEHGRPTAAEIHRAMADQERKPKRYGWTSSETEDFCYICLRSPADAAIAAGQVGWDIVLEMGPEENRVIYSDDGLEHLIDLSSLYLDLQRDPRTCLPAPGDLEDSFSR